MEFRLPDRDLVADLRNPRDNDLGDAENVCTACNRHLRLYVAGWMLFDDPRAALALYQGCGRDLLERPGHLTTAIIISEVIHMATEEAAQ